MGPRRRSSNADRGPDPRAVPGSGVTEGTLSGLVGVVVVLVEAGLELLLGLAQRAGQLGQLRPAEQQQDHDENDEQLWCAEIHEPQGTSPPMPPRTGTARLLSPVAEASRFVGRPGQPAWSAAARRISAR